MENEKIEPVEIKTDDKSVIEAYLDLFPCDDESKKELEKKAKESINMIPEPMRVSFIITSINLKHYLEVLEIKNYRNIYIQDFLEYNFVEQVAEFSYIADQLVTNDYLFNNIVIKRRTPLIFRNTFEYMLMLEQFYEEFKRFENKDTILDFNVAGFRAEKLLKKYISIELVANNKDPWYVEGILSNFESLIYWITYDVDYVEEPEEIQIILDYQYFRSHILALADDVYYDIKSRLAKIDDKDIIDYKLSQPSYLRRLEKIDELISMVHIATNDDLQEEDETEESEEKDDSEPKKN